MRTLGRLRVQLRRLFYGHRPAAVAFQSGLLAVDLAAITYASTGGPTLNLRIAGLNLTQSVQTFGNEIPLVAGRDAFLRDDVIGEVSARHSVGMQLQ